MAGCAESHCLKLLAFDTSTELLSVAALRGEPGGELPLEYTSAGGAQASTALIPAIQQLLAQAGLRLGEALHLRADKACKESARLEVGGKRGRVRTVALLDPDALAEYPAGRTSSRPPPVSGGGCKRECTPGARCWG